MNSISQGIRKCLWHSASIVIPGLLLSSSVVAQDASPRMTASGSASVERRQWLHHELGDSFDRGVAGNDDVKLHLRPPINWTMTEIDIDNYLENVRKAGYKIADPPPVGLVWTWNRADSSAVNVNLSNLTIACATVTGSTWNPENRSQVFERITDVAQSMLSEWMNVTEPLAKTQEKPEYNERIQWQSFDVEGRAKADLGGYNNTELDRLAVSGKGRHFFGFLPDSKLMLVCSAVCLEPKQRPVDDRVCPSAVDSIELQGSLTSEPSITFGGTLKKVFDSPKTVITVVIALLLVFLGVLAILRGLLLHPPSARISHADRPG